MAMPGMPAPDLADRGDDSPQHQNAAHRVWFWAAYLTVTDTPGMSALLLQRQLGLRRYETGGMLLHKLRRAIVNAAREPLHGEVEMDDTWIGGPQAGLRGSRQLRGRGAALVLVAVEKRGTQSGRVRMAVIADFKATTLLAFIKQQVAPGATIYTDGLKHSPACRPPAFGTTRARNRPARRCAREPSRSCPWRTARSAIFNSGSSELIMVSVVHSFRSTWTSSRSASTVGGHRPRLFRRCWGSALRARRPPTDAFGTHRMWRSPTDRDILGSA
jgi:hypothetical protein